MRDLLFLLVLLLCCGVYVFVENFCLMNVFCVCPVLDSGMQVFFLFHLSKQGSVFPTIVIGFIDAGQS